MKQTLLVFTAILFSIDSFSQLKTKSSSGKPLVIGEVAEIHSAILSENRKLNIYLPDGYHTDDTTRYPVVYLLDGGMDEDFLHITGLYQFNSFPWIKRVAPSIVIGIVNNDRRRDYTFPTLDTADKRRYPTVGHSDKFIDFIEKELQPYVRATFRVNESATLIGESLGGLLATEILLKRPTLFSTYIIVSPSLWWDNGSLLSLPMTNLKTQLRQPISIYIGVGKEGLTPGNTPRVMEVDANVLADKITALDNKNLSVWFDYLPDENHATILHQAVLNALKRLAPDMNQRN